MAEAPMAQYITEDHPAPYIEKTCLGFTAQIRHHLSTCRYAPSRVDANQRLDLELKVRGVQGLRVIDALTMLTLISANTNVPT
jgi:choline dehydrogenase-like flavoprotein